jgi:uncharacterized protein (UPF0276 family)
MRMQSMAARGTAPGARPIPASAVIGLRACHHAEILRTSPAIGWFEAHSENYFSAEGPARRALLEIGARYPLSLHGVGLSLGSADPLDRTHLDELASLVRAARPALVSEHLSWNSVDGTFVNDLLPMPYTGEALRHLAARIAQVQEELGRQILIENISSYVTFSGPEMHEWDFLAELVRECGCGLLVDVNNIYVSAMNFGFDALTYLRALPVAAVQEIHLAGHSICRVGGREIRIDTHGAPVCDEVWNLYADALRRFGAVPTLIEWDTDIPALAVLASEAGKADQLLEDRRELAA